MNGDESEPDYARDETKDTSIFRYYDNIDNDVIPEVWNKWLFLPIWSVAFDYYGLFVTLNREMADYSSAILWQITVASRMTKFFPTYMKYQVFTIALKTPRGGALHDSFQRDKAWTIRAYSCTGQGLFLNLLITRYPTYPEIPEKSKAGRGLVEVGGMIWGDW
jgi:hypothetical protein